MLTAFVSQTKTQPYIQRPQTFNVYPDYIYIDPSIPPLQTPKYAYNTPSLPLLTNHRNSRTLPP